jgi:glycine cleavage system H protein
MKVPENLQYTEEHEWVGIEDDVATIGVTDYAQSELGDIVFIELPSVGDKITKGESFGTIEAVKAVSDLFAPVSGEVLEVNEDLNDTPEKINESPYDEGWMIRVRIDDESELETLLSPDAYSDVIG